MVLAPYHLRGCGTSGNDASSEDSTLIIDWNDPPMPSDHEDIDENTDLSKNDCTEEKNGVEAKIEEHTKAIKHLKEKF